MKIKDKNIGKFLIELSSSSPTPGGGAVAALSGAVAASLVEMVLRLSKDGGLKAHLPKARQLRLKLLALADEDVLAFDEVVVAYKKKSKEGMKRALKVAIAVPEKVVGLSNEVENIAKLLVKKGNRNALSDAKTALFLAKSAQASAKENILINKKALKKL